MHCHNNGDLKKLNNIQSAALICVWNTKIYLELKRTQVQKRYIFSK